MPTSRTLLARAAVLALAVGGCGGPSPASLDDAPPAGTVAGVPDPDAIDPARLAPLAGLPACPTDQPAPPEVDLDLGDVPLPAGAVVTGGADDGPLRSAQGITLRTPVEVMVDYLRLEDWEVLAAEDEVFESEVLLERDGVRLFVKSQASCARGSAFVLFVSRDEGLVPAPAGGAG